MFATAEAPPTGKAYLGIGAEAGVGGQPGLVVREVAPDSPAAKAGLKDGDRIVQAGDRQIRSINDLKDALAGQIPGDKIAFKVMRDGKEQSLTVTLGKEPTGPAEAPPAAIQPSGAYLGVFSQPLNAAMKDRLGIKADKGALVARVMPGSPAAKAGVAELDVVTRLGDTDVTSPMDLRQAVEKVGAGKDANLQVIRDGKTLTLKVHLAQEPVGAFGRDGWMQEPPQDFGRFQNRMPSFFSDREKIAALEKKIQELEKRIDQLEKTHK
jgi:S1-C subfamily serine protease